MAQHRALSRLEQLIIFILKSAQKKKIENLSRFEMMKLVYLIEIESIKYIGERFSSTTKFVRDTNGPISYDIYEAVNNLRELGLVEITQEDNPEYGHPRVCHGLTSKVASVDFTNNETIFLNSILRDYLGIPQKKLKEIAYATEPMLKKMEQEKSKGVEVLKGSPINMDSVSLDSDVLAVITG